jgi:arsenite methyltransferase
MVAGVDLSPDMVKMAQRVAPRADLRLGSSDALPFPNGSFDKALAVHTVYFWDNLVQHLSEIGRVLRPGGLLVLGFRPADAAALASFPRTTHHFRNADEIATALRSAGFGRIQTTSPAGSLVVFIEAALVSESP